MSRHSGTRGLLLLLGLSLAGCGDDNGPKVDAGRDGGGTLDARRDGAIDAVDSRAIDAGADRQGDAVTIVDGPTLDGEGARDVAADERDAALDGVAVGETRGDGAAVDGAIGEAGISEGGAVDGLPANIFVATLTGAEEMPPVATTAGGSATFVLSTDRTQLTYAITQTVANATAVDIRSGAGGENGPLAYTLAPVSAAMSGMFMLNPGDADKLESGMLYLNVHSQANPTGELRGQILRPGDTLWVANMTGGQETPPVTSAATGHAAVILDSSKAMLRYHVTTTGLTGATAAHFHKSVATLPGPVVYPITPVGPTMDGTITITSQDATDIMAGRWFVNAHTTANPNGEIRGQLILPGEILYAATLSGTNVVPPVATSSASGGAEFMLSPSGTTLRYVADITGAASTAATINNAAAGANGPVVFPLTFSAGGLMGTLTVSAVDISNLNGGNYYVNIQTAANPTSELRGQITMQ